MNLCDSGTTAFIRIGDFFHHISETVKGRPDFGSEERLTDLDYFNNEGLRASVFANQVYNDLLILEQITFQKIQHTGFKGSEHDLITELKSLYDQKNEDYGDSFDRGIQVFGIVSAVTRMFDKICRIETLEADGYQSNVKSESLKDSLIDLYNYSIMTRMYLANRVSPFKTELNRLIDSKSEYDVPNQAKDETYLKSSQFLDNMDEVDEHDESVQSNGEDVSVDVSVDETEPEHLEQGRENQAHEHHSEHTNNKQSDEDELSEVSNINIQTEDGDVKHLPKQKRNKFRR